MCQQPNQYLQQSSEQQQKFAKDNGGSHHQKSVANLIPKIEAMDSSGSCSLSKQQHSLENHSYINVNFDSQSIEHSMNNALKSSSPSHDLSKELPTDTMAFFDETLELSQEDIQKTLSANMPINARNNSVAESSTSGNVLSQRVHNTEVVNDMNGQLNPMDFIDNCCDDGNVGVPSVHDDDVFVNLDAFDMFVEFPELDLDAKTSLGDNGDGSIIDMNEEMAESIASMRDSHHSIDGSSGGRPLLEDIDGRAESQTQSSSQYSAHQLVQENRGDLFTISDYSPEWAYPEGGIKVLVTGPWNLNSNYTVLFDSFPVPTTIVQSGVLRCYCPAHEVGLATLQVACDGYVISNSCIFEYKAPVNTESGSACDGTTNVPGNGAEHVYKFNLFNRLECIDERMQIKTEPSDSVRNTKFDYSLPR